MRRTLRYLLLAALTLVCGSTFAEDKTVTWDASTNDALPNVSVGNDITLTWIEGSGDQAPSYSTQSNKKVVYMKKGNKTDGSWCCRCCNHQQDRVHLCWRQHRSYTQRWIKQLQLFRQHQHLDWRS